MSEEEAEAVEEEVRCEVCDKAFGPRRRRAALPVEAAPRGAEEAAQGPGCGRAGGARRRLVVVGVVGGLRRVPGSQPPAAMATASCLLPGGPRDFAGAGRRARTEHVLAATVREVEIRVYYCRLSDKRPLAIVQVLNTSRGRRA